MSLNFTGATTDRFNGTNFGTDPTVFTAMFWHFIRASTNDRKLFSKNGANLFRSRLRRAATGRGCGCRSTIRPPPV